MRQVSAANNWVSSLARVAAGYASVYAAIGLVNRGIQEQIRIGQEAFQGSMRRADAERNMFLNMGPTAWGPSGKVFQQRIAALGPQVGYGPEETPTLAGQLFSATQGAAADPARWGTVERMLRAAAPLFQGENKMDLGPVAGSAMALRLDPRVKAKMSERQTVGFMLNLLSQSPGITPDTLRYTIPSLVGAQVARPNTPDQMRNMLEAAAITAAIGSRIGDVSMERTGTAAGNFFEVLSSMVPENQTGTILDVLREVQADPKRAAVIASKVKGKSQTKGPQRELLNKMVTMLLVENILPELEIPSEALLQEQVNALQNMTPDMQRAFIARQYASRARARQMDADAVKGQVYTQLWGGTIDGQQVPGILEQQRMGGGAVERLHGWMIDQTLGRVIYGTSRALGLDPAAAAEATAVGSLTAKSLSQKAMSLLPGVGRLYPQAKLEWALAGDKLPSRRISRTAEYLDMLRKDVFVEATPRVLRAQEKLQDVYSSPEFFERQEKMYKQFDKRTEAIETRARSATNSINSAAAASQKSAHTE